MSILTPHQSKALNIERSISLTANAGSGKTFVLSQRFIEILIQTSTPLNQIAAITFTEKAAGQLFKRISEELNNLLLTSEDKDARNRVEKIRKQLVSAKISTIHSFCIDLLKEFPVEASIDANFIPINEQKASELINLSIENSLKRLLQEPDKQSDVKQLIRLFGSRSILGSELLGMLSKREIVLKLIDKYYSSAEDEITKLLFELFISNLKILFEKELPVVLTHLKLINKIVLESDSQNESATEINIVLSNITGGQNELNILLKLEGLRNKILTSGGTVRIQGYLLTRIRNEVHDSIGIVEDFFSQLNEIKITDDHISIERELTKYSFAMIRVFQEVLSTYETKKSELGVLDFEDILIRTKKLLENKWVKESLSGKYKYLLIDEYQDTNEIQYEIFLPLVDDLKTGNLFIVGDEKQSIYRFRNAELQVFSKTKTDIENISGKDSLLTLPDSFRMAPAICFFVNSLFNELFSEPELFFNEVAASDLVCARADDFQGQVEFLIADGEKITEAELLARRILNLKSEHRERITKWGAIAVLVRKRASFSELQKVFIKYHIPFNLIGGTGFYQKQSINDIFNYFSFMLNDKDDGALIGVLRSPFFLVSDTNIFELALLQGESLWEKIKTAALSEKKSWKRIYEVLNENKKLAKRVNVSWLLRKILRDSNFISIISSRIDCEQEISNLDKLISITNEFFVGEFNTIYDYVLFLKESITGFEDEAQGPIGSANDGVNILTIHQAKGLEYPAVFLYKSNDTTLVNKVKAKSFTIDKIFGFLTKVPVDDNYFADYRSAPVIGIYNLIESKKEKAELKRLLYVGVTRAKDFLFITQTDDGKSVRQNSFSELLNTGLNIDLSGERFVLEGELTYLRKNSDLFVISTESINLKIPLTREIESTQNLIEKKTINPESLKLILSEVSDHSKGEVISATRFSTFISCPLQYNLLYNFKLGDLIKMSSKYKSKLQIKTQEDYNQNELNSFLFDDETRLDEFSKYKGKLIHYFLQKNLSREVLTEFIESQISNNFNSTIPESKIKAVIKDLADFFDSVEFKFINSFKNYTNEFEAYLKIEDYYLFGILDKLIIDEKKLIIVDYKTDNIKQDEISSRTNKYLPQLEFYAYIISRLFTKKYQIEGRIIFIKFPANPYVIKYDDEADMKTGMNIKKMIQSIRANDYSSNLTACSDCIFADSNSNCIKT